MKRLKFFLSDQTGNTILWENVINGGSVPWEKPQQRIPPKDLCQILPYSKVIHVAWLIYHVLQSSEVLCSKIKVKDSDNHDPNSSDDGENEQYKTEDVLCCVILIRRQEFEIVHPVRNEKSDDHENSPQSLWQIEEQEGLLVLEKDFPRKS